MKEQSGQRDILVFLVLKQQLFHEFIVFIEYMHIMAVHPVGPVQHMDVFSALRTQTIIIQQQLVKSVFSEYSFRQNRQIRSSGAANLRIVSWNRSWKPPDTDTLLPGHENSGLPVRISEPGWPW